MSILKSFFRKKGRPRFNKNFRAPVPEIRTPTNYTVVGPKVVAPNGVYPIELDLSHTQHVMNALRPERPANGSVEETTMLLVRRDGTVFAAFEGHIVARLESDVADRIDSAMTQIGVDEIQCLAIVKLHPLIHDKDTRKFRARVAVNVVGPVEIEHQT